MTTWKGRNTVTGGQLEFNQWMKEIKRIKETAIQEMSTDWQPIHTQQVSSLLYPIQFTIRIVTHRTQTKENLFYWVQSKGCGQRANTILMSTELFKVRRAQSY